MRLNDPLLHSEHVLHNVSHLHLASHAAFWTAHHDLHTPCWTMWFALLVCDWYERRRLHARRKLFPRQETALRGKMMLWFAQWIGNGHVSYHNICNDNATMGCYMGLLYTSRLLKGSLAFARGHYELWPLQLYVLIARGISESKISKTTVCWHHPILCFYGKA